MFLRQCASNFGRGKSLRFSHILKKKSANLGQKKRKSPKTLQKQLNFRAQIEVSIEKLSERVLGSNFVQRLLFVTSKKLGKSADKINWIGTKTDPAHIAHYRRTKKRKRYTIVW